MNLFEILLISIGLAMDAFAISVCKGLSVKKIDYKKASIVGLYFGFFQAFMPFIGYIVGNTFEGFIVSIDHWIVFALLALIGGNMIKETFSSENTKISDNVDFGSMFFLAIATSIDALAVGITFAFLDVNLFLAISTIGITTFTLSAIGVIIGSSFGNKFEKKAEFVGGIILILIGLKILLEHLGVLC